jgi:hypothetical protein
VRNTRSGALILDENPFASWPIVSSPGRRGCSDDPHCAALPNVVLDDQRARPSVSSQPNSSTSSRGEFVAPISEHPPTVRVLHATLTPALSRQRLTASTSRQRFQASVHARALRQRSRQRFTPAFTPALYASAARRALHGRPAGASRCTPGRPLYFHGQCYSALRRGLPSNQVTTPTIIATLKTASHQNGRAMSALRCSTTLSNSTTPRAARP